MVDRAGAVVGQVAHHPEPVGELVDRGQPVEEGAVEAVAGDLDGGHPVLEGYVDRDRAEPVVDRGRVPEGLREGGPDASGQSSVERLT